MKHVRLSMTAHGQEGEIHQMYDLMANAPFVNRAKTTHWNYSGQELGIMHYVEGERAPFEAALTDISTVDAYEITQVDEGCFYAYLMCETTPEAREMFGALTRGRLVVNHPLEWENGRVSVAVVGTSAEIQAAIDRIPDVVDVELDEIGGLERASEATTGVLTDRQREAVETALELGYYENPRKSSLEEIAERIGCGRSTAAEHLRKSEAKILRSVFGE